MSSHSILFATDFTARDEAAFESACRLALMWGANLRVLHVEDVRTDAFSESKRKNVDVEFQRYIPEDFGIMFEHVVVRGEPAETILKYAETTNCDLIVLGTHGRVGLDRAFAGSVAEQVMRNAKIPVMTIRDGVENMPNQDAPKILVPVDFSVYGYAALDFATRIAIASGAELTIVYVDSSDGALTKALITGRPELSEHERNLWASLKQFIPKSEKVVFNHGLLKGEPGRQICDFANSMNFDLVVIGTHGRSGLGRILIGSVAEDVVRNSDCPVISVKPSNKRSSILAS